MKRINFRVVSTMLFTAGLVTLMSTSAMSQSSPKSSALPSTANGEWPTYTADVHGSKYSPLAQIDGSNFSKLEEVWHFKTDNLGPRPENKLEGTPLMIKGMIYATAGTSRSVIALDGKTGQLKWVYSMDEGERATRWAPRQLSGRGLSYWTDGKGDDRVIYITTGYRLVELNATTGQPIESFGKKGMVDLKVGVVIGKNKQVDLEKAEIGLHSTPLVVNDTVIVGSSMFEGLGYRYSTNVKGLVRAFNVRTGKQIWRFDTIPKPGELGNDTWKDGSWEWSGNVGVWTQITADPELGLVFLPVETPTIDEYGGNRIGDNLFAESLVAVDLKSGKRRWHFQFVHHPLWDFDISAAPLVMDAHINGQARKLVAVPTKQGWLYTFDRITGQPIWPMPEKPVPQSDIPGETTSLTQPFPSAPPPYSRTYVADSDVIDFTPKLHEQALENLKKFRWEQSPFVPPVLVGPGQKYLGSINIANTAGGVNWPGSGFDPETGIFYTQAGNSAVTVGSFGPEEFEDVRPEHQAKMSPNGRIPRWEAEPNYGLRTAGFAGFSGPARSARQALVQGLDGLPIVKPPYGVLAAIDLNTGALKFQVPHGDTPDNVRNSPALKGMNIPKTGQSGSVGVLVTKTLVISGDPQITSPPGRPRGAMLRAYNKNTGEQVGEVLMPAAISGSPMTYSIDGKQYIIVAVSGGSYTGEYIAYRLPNTAQ